MHYVSIFAYILWKRFYNLGLWLNSGRSTFEAAASEESKPRMLVGSMAKKINYNKYGCNTKKIHIRLTYQKILFRMEVQTL